MKPFVKPPDTLVIHCTASPNGVKRSVDQIRYDHLHREPPFSDIGYHWVIDADGKVYPGRPERLTGAGVENENYHTLHVVMVGTDKFSLAQWFSLKEKTDDILKRYPSIKKVCGHRDFSPDLNHDGRIDPMEWIKKCPSFDVLEWLGNDMTPKPENVLEGK